MPRERWRGLLAARQFIVPSPMTKVCGLTRAGKRSTHTLDNTGPRQFLVVEFDSGNFDEHAALLHHLAEFCPFVMAVHSGGKSIHGWFCCGGRDEANLLRFMRYAVSLGADPATWIKSQFVRFARRSPRQWQASGSVVFQSPYSGEHMNENVIAIPSGQGEAPRVEDNGEIPTQLKACQTATVVLAQSETRILTAFTEVQPIPSFTFGRSHHYRVRCTSL